MIKISEIVIQNLSYLADFYNIISWALMLIGSVTSFVCVGVGLMEGYVSVDESEYKKSKILIISGLLIAIISYFIAFLIYFFVIY